MASRSKIIREERLIQDCKKSNQDIMQALLKSHAHLLDEFAWIANKISTSNKSDDNNIEISKTKQKWLDGVIKHNNGRAILKYVKKHHSNLGIRLVAGELLDSYGANGSSVRSRRRCVLCYKPRGVRRLGVCASCLKLAVRTGTIPAVIQGRKR